MAARDATVSAMRDRTHVRKSTPACISTQQHVLALADDGYDPWQQGGGDHGVAFRGQMYKVNGVIPQRDFLIVHDHLNRASMQSALHLHDVGSTLLFGAEETQIV